MQYAPLSHMGSGLSLGLGVEPMVRCHFTAMRTRVFSSIAAHSVEIYDVGYDGRLHLLKRSTGVPLLVCRRVQRKERCMLLVPRRHLLLPLRLILLPHAPLALPSPCQNHSGQTIHLFA
jgi:hypothetical protein